jgi:hypothetical protein
MNSSLENSPVVPKRSSHRKQGSTRTALLIVPAFVAGVALSALWFNHQHAAPQVEATPALSAGTEQTLQHLSAPVQVRFYSLLDPASVSDSTKAFAGRVAQLLAKYQEQSNGKINLSCIDSQSSSNANAALADGIKPFNMDKGDACYLGVTVSANGQKESLASLSPDWEQALESDLTRAIARTATPPDSQVTRPAETAALNNLKSTIPNPESVSLEDVTQMLKQAGLAAFAQATQEMQAKVKEAQDRLLQAQAGQSATDQQTALQNLQQVQADETAKLKQIALDSKDQIDVFTKLKNSGH